MSEKKLLQTDSIQELAHFWDTHDLTEFEAELEEAAESVFEQDVLVRIHLTPAEAAAVKRIAESQGVGFAELIQGWVAEKAQSG